MSADRAAGALIGLAAGDAAGFPALYHRMIPLPRRRRMLWTQAMELEDERINKVPLPFTLSASPDLLRFSGTDDAEQAVLAARVLLRCGPDPSADELFDAWMAQLGPHAGTAWLAVSDRAALENAANGLRPPQTGTDNPHSYDDAALARAVPVGVRWSDDPGTAAAVAGRLASITHADVGIDGARAMAAAIAVLVGGGAASDAVVAARAEVRPDTWLSRGVDRAFAALDEAGGPFAAVPLWTERVVNPEYNFGNVVAETFPVALAILASTGGFAEAIAVAALLPKQADTMPALVGALHGALAGASAIPVTWQERVDVVRGVCLPFTADASLTATAAALLEGTRGGGRA